LDATRLQWLRLPDQKQRCDVTVVAAGFSSKGQVVANRVKQLEVVVDEKKYAQVLTTGMVIFLAIEVPPTTVRMRVVARDSTNGNIGTADLTAEGRQFH
jgi:hypothetical protein